MIEVAVLTGKEVKHMVVAYNFDLRTNELSAKLVPNPAAGRAHVFKVYGVNGDLEEPVTLSERVTGKADPRI